MNKFRWCRVDAQQYFPYNDYYRFKKVCNLVLNNDFYGAACIVDTRIQNNVPEYYKSTDFVLPALDIDYRSNEFFGYEAISYGVLAITAIENWELFSYTKGFNNNKRAFDKTLLPENIVSKMKKEIKGAIYRN